MPSSNHLTNYYKKCLPEYKNKIKTNKMIIDTNNQLSNLTNKKIITV